MDEHRCTKTAWAILRMRRIRPGHLANAQNTHERLTAVPRDRYKRLEVVFLVRFSCVSSSLRIKR